MADNFPLLPIDRKAGGAIAKCRIMKFGGADGVMLQASAATDLLVAVSGPREDVASGDLVESHFAGVMPLEYGAAVTRGKKLTSDASGRGVEAAAGNQIIGTASESGILGTIGGVIITPGQLGQGA